MYKGCTFKVHLIIIYTLKEFLLIILYNYSSYCYWGSVSINHCTDYSDYINALRVVEEET